MPTKRKYNLSDAAKAQRKVASLAASERAQRRRAGALLARTRWDTTGTTQPHADAARENGKLGGRPRMRNCPKCNAPCGSAKESKAHCKLVL